MTKPSITKARIIDKAVELAQKSSWESFSLMQLVQSLDSSMLELKSNYRSKDDLAEALFDRADEAMLKITSQEDFYALSSDEKLLRCIMSWFESMLAYKGVMREILTYKLEPGHFHLQAHGITRISRTVQWFREAACREHTGLNRIADEIAVTGAYLAAFSFFLVDRSPQHTNTRALLKGLIAKINQANHLLARIGGKKQPVSDDGNNQKSVL
ncbi:MAG: TetR/AcrR family transcriptional regulator [Deltaproteobacteria bacterium]|nr:TetR/AcrR family transcriptional regulator [Deltaproteobacteria bacterium]